MKFFSRITVVLAVMALTAASTAAQVTLLLSVDQIQGQSSNREYPFAIPISSAEWGVETPTNLAMGGAATGATRASIVMIRKGVDDTSPQLLQLVTTQGMVQNAVLHVLVPNSRGMLVEAQTITFEGATFVSIRQVLESQGVAEEIGLVYSLITVTSSEGYEHQWGWNMAGGG